MATTLVNNKKLFVFDCDSTIIQNEVIDLIAEEAGTGELVANITERAMQGEIDFEGSLRERVATLEGLDEGVFERVYKKITLTVGVRELFKKIHDEDGYVAIVSGGFHEVLDPLAKDLGADVWVANRLEVVDGKLTGGLTSKVVDSNVKAQMLGEWAKQFRVDVKDTVAVGDGANDIPMMQKAGISFAFNAKPKVKEAADFSVEEDLRKIIPFVY